ncbi:acyl-CoA thioesterase [Novipirellula galeiformis]|uniref:acyl-CoA thioesterase n=1 Tax=Novipirellula galeiformis TaxID=2528004 RepID=UPI001E324CE2|nr:thioesterase family protein [Novipirellula galeiformis]
MYTTQRRVEFRDTDAAGIVHFSAFFPLMESAEHEMLRSLGISVMPSRSGEDRPESAFHPAEIASRGQEKDLKASDAVANSPSPSLPHVTWPRVSAHCDYRAAARFEDLLEISVSVLQLGNSSVQYGFRFTRPASPQGADNHGPPSLPVTLIAEGKLTAVCCQLAGGGRLTKTPIPEELRKLLAKHLDQQTFSA